MKKMATVFFGTHQFAVTILEGLLKSPFCEVELVITRPDRPVGRKQEMLPSPVKLLAQKSGLLIDQPTTLKSYQLPATSYQLAVVAQYGLLIPKVILDAFPLGIINVHTSLLPKYRGASPIQSALINGEKETGVTIMKMDEGLDTGPVLLQKKIVIEPDDTYLDLDKKLATLGVEALCDALPKYIDGLITPQPQDETAVTTCRELTREAGKIDWRKNSQQIYNQYRGLTPWPGIWTTWQGKRLKLLHVKPSDKKFSAGTVCVIDEQIFVGTKLESVEIMGLQLEGKNPMDAKAFANGHKEINGDTLV